MQFRAKQIAPPKEWGTFEDLCHALFKRVWKDPLAQKNGRRGQAQHGVDVFGSPNGDRRSYRGVQCKGKDTNYGSRAEWSEVLAEVAKAERFSPKLDEWIFSTTAPVDAALQRAAREFSVEHRAKGLFSVDVLGWEEIQALMADAPDVIAEFYPEHADHLPQVIEALRALPSLEAKLAGLVEKIDAKLLEPSNPHGSAVWEMVTLDGDRGMGPALMGYPLGPSDASACPRLTEVGTILTQLRIAYSARLIGEPGAGKSICSYQAAKELAADGFEVLRLLDPQADNITLEAALPGRHRLYLIDDAHLLKPHILNRMEDQAGPDRMVLSTHNAVEPVSHRGAITLDAKRAVKTIAAALRADLPNTLKAVRLADDDVGERMMNTDLGERLDHAENAADRPWQFCFVLGGGWRRSKQAADSARAANADLILAAVAIRQMVSRDARALPAEIAQVCERAGINNEAVDQGLEWLGKQRLIVGASDCRTPHQRFASVVLKRILEGQDKDGREKIATMIEGALCDPQFPHAGLRVLIHELRFGSGDYSWSRLLGQPGVEAAVARCWAAAGSDRGFAALALSDLWDFAEGGATAVVGPHVTTLANWISNPSHGAYGFGHILNNLAQEDPDVAKKVVAASDPVAIATAYSNANPDTAYGLADLLRSVAYVKVDDFNATVRATLNRDKLRELANHEDFLKDAFIFSKFCASVVWWDENLALEMAERFVPTAQQVLAKDPVEGFHQLSRDFASTVLRVFDALHVYVGKLKPTRRQWSIARRICEKIDPKRTAEQISTVRPRHFQSAGFFLHFLSQSAPRKYEAVLRQLSWEKLNSVIGDDWANMPHDTEVLLGTLYLRSPTQQLVQKFISNNSDRIVHFPPRLMLMAPEVGLEHLAKGGSLRLAEYGHLSWDFGGIALAIIAESRPELVEQAVTPFVGAIARGLTNYNRDSTGPAEGLVRVVIEHAPIAWRGVLAELDPAVAEKNLAECLTRDEDHRRTAAAVIESAITLDSAIGDMARRLRARFPKASTASIDTAPFSQRRGWSRGKRKG
ncbi:MAG: hypothetical protein BroJett021_52330 [Chloroflexota bacterium]|nr:MAG: hypothetical protein BroJett021_52330 [Chloroflexota bacterium]